MAIACIQGYTGEAYVDKLPYPAAGLIIIGEYSFFAGDANSEESVQLAENLFDFNPSKAAPSRSSHFTFPFHPLSALQNELSFFESSFFYSDTLRFAVGKMIKIKEFSRSYSSFRNRKMQNSSQKSIIVNLY